MNIYVYSRAAGERVMASISRFLERRLRLKVNLEKSAVAPVEERKFLGYRLSRAGRLGIAPKSLKRMIAELDAYLPGWLMYFRYGANKSQLRLLDSWVRMRVRSFKTKQRCRNDNWRLPNRRLSKWGLLSLLDCRPETTIAFTRAQTWGAGRGSLQ